MAKKPSKAKPPASATKATPVGRAATVAAAAPGLSNERIGSVAGELWQALSANGGLTLAALKKSVDAPDDLVLAALGWLAREDKLAYETAGRTVKVLLQT